jgi:hypothetical protein
MNYLDILPEDILLKIYSYVDKLKEKDKRIFDKFSLYFIHTLKINIYSVYHKYDRPNIEHLFYLVTDNTDFYDYYDFLDNFIYNKLKSNKMSRTTLINLINNRLKNNIRIL